MSSVHPFHRERRQGFTLLEVLLGLVLAAMILMAVAGAVYLHLHVLQFGREEVEQALLARSLLRQIGSDLHCAVSLPPEDQSALITVAANSTESSSGLGGTTKLSSLSSNSSSLSSNSTSSSSSDDSSDSSVVWTSGLLGSATCLQVDVSRMPRPSELPVGDSTSIIYPGGPPCDVKKVTYFLGGDASAALPNSTGSAALGVMASGSVGLCRCEQPCAVGAYATSQGSTTGRVDCLAPEVTGLEFSYYDGSEWVDEWDSADKKALPIAVEVAIAVAPPNQEQAGSGTPTTRIYRLLVHLPTAQVSTSDSTTTTSNNTTTTSGNNTQ